MQMFAEVAQTYMNCNCEVGTVNCELWRETLSCEVATLNCEVESMNRELWRRNYVPELWRRNYEPWIE